ncbi:hypothetical protein TRAPUB_7655 [Trametes pubescens]|uniref:Uncharacterized protein n=1 Tax=Trametes pubescens TaxID=154538 RepID=A0A1M2V2S5_TRAPU|nr:hypothetical protein TRAPUB_7655 [Trametes pubescens]
MTVAATAGTAKLLVIATATANAMNHAVIRSATETRAKEITAANAMAAAVERQVVEVQVQAVVQVARITKNMHGVTAMTIAAANAAEEEETTTTDTVGHRVTTTVEDGGGGGAVMR